jgi:transposase
MAQWRRGKIIEIKVPAEHRQRVLVLLQEISVSRTRGISEVVRAKLLLAALADPRGASVAQLEWQFPELGMARREIEDRLLWMAQCLRKLPPEPVYCKVLHEVLRCALADRPRSGAKRTITSEQQTKIIAMALQPPKTFGLPFPRWSAPDLASQVV